MRRARARSGIPRYPQSLSVLRAVTMFLTVPLFAAIILSPVKHGLEEYEVFLGFWALLVLPFGIETARAGPVRRWLGLGLCVVAIASLMMVIGWIAGGGPNGVAVLALGTALVTLGLACQVVRIFAST